MSSDVSGKSSVSAGKVIEKFFNSDLLIEAYPKSLTKFMEPMIGSPMDAQGPKSVYGCLTMYFISGFGSSLVFSTLVSDAGVDKVDPAAGEGVEERSLNGVFLRGIAFSIGV